MFPHQQGLHHSPRRSRAALLGVAGLLLVAIALIGDIRSGSKVGTLLTQHDISGRIQSWRSGSPGAVASNPPPPRCKKLLWFSALGSLVSGAYMHTPINYLDYLKVALYTQQRYSPDLVPHIM